MTKLAMVVALLSGCGSKSDAPATGSGSATGSAAGSSTGSAAGSATGSAAGSATAAKPTTSVDAAVTVDAAAAPGVDAAPAKAGITPRKPPVEMAWAIRGNALTVKVVDDAGPPDVSKLIVEGDDKDHVLVTTRSKCLDGEHAAQLVAGKHNTVLFRCETWGKGNETIFADEWLIRWQPDKDFPTIYRHWRGERFARDPKWAGHRQWYPEQEINDNDMTECCCHWEDQDNLGNEVTSARYCKGSEDHHGVCVDASKCKTTDSEE